MLSNNIKGEEQQSQEDLLPLIQTYLGASLFRNAQKYQTITHNHAQYLEFAYEKVPIHTENDVQPLVESNLQQLLKEQPKMGSKMRILRILQYSHVLHCLTMEEEMPLNDDKFSIVAIVFENKQAARHWKNRYSFLTKISITGYFKSLYKFSAHSICNILVTRLENIYVQSRITIAKCDSEELKAQANTKFRERKYVQALFQYEMGLGLIHNPQKKRQRAILYANSSQCLFEMKLYQSALIYASISITLDRTYIKGIYKKFCCLLELKMFKEVSSAMMALSDAGNSQFQKAQTIFHRHHQHNIGLFDWKEIFNGLPLNFGEYLSAKVQTPKEEVMNTNSRANFIVGEVIKPFEMILFSKPLVYQKSQQAKFSNDYQSLKQQLKKYCKFEDLFNERFRFLPSQCEIQGRILKFNKSNPQGMEDNEIHSKCLRCLQNQKTLCFRSSKQQYIGIWQSLHRFKHSCLPNCTYIHIKGGLAVFSLKRIREGETLSLDFLNEETKYRSIKIKQKFGKICNCAFCQWDWNYDFQTTGQLLYDFYKGEKNKLIEGGLQKISMFFLWELIFKKQFNEVELIKEYLQLLQKYPLWEGIINCLNYLRVSKKNDAFDLLKSTIKKLFQKFFKMTHSQAVELLKTLL